MNTAESPGGRKARHRVTVTSRTAGTTPQEKKEYRPTSLLAKTRGKSRTRKLRAAIGDVEEDDVFKGFVSRFCLNCMDLVDLYTNPNAEDFLDDEDESTLEEPISSPREWIGSILDFSQAPSSTVEETETEAEQGVFDKLAEELHTIIEVSSESDLENNTQTVDVPANRSFSFSQGNEDMMSHSFSNTDNEIEPGWYRRVSLQKKTPTVEATTTTPTQSGSNEATSP